MPFLLFFAHPGAISPMRAISPMGAILRMITVYKDRKVDKKIGMDIVPKVSDLPFENDTIRNTVPTLFRYIGKDNDKTITIRQNDEKTHACQGTRRYQVQHKHHIAYIPGSTCPWRLPSGKGIWSTRPLRVCGFYRVVWLHGEHVRAALCGIQFVFELS